MKKATSKVARPVGRPRALDRTKLMHDVCARIAKGALVKDAARAAGTEAHNVRVWGLTDEFATLYERARVSQAHAMAEECVALADSAIPGKEGNVDKVRLQVDTRKWVTSKIAPKLYGDKLDVTSAGNEIVAGVILLPMEAA